MFFPYNERHLRCHPNAYLITSSYPFNQCAKSRLVVTYKCSICSLECTQISRKLTTQTMLCSIHFKSIRGRHVRYKGDIEPKISRPIRAGLLLGVDRSQLVELVSSLISVSKPKIVAQKSIDEIAKYSIVELTDNCFWGDDSFARVTKERYIRPKKKQKLYKEQEQNMVCPLYQL